MKTKRIRLGAIVLVGCLAIPAFVEARYYDPKTGRFLQRDPETPGQVRVRKNKVEVVKPAPSPTNSQDLHPYTYVGNNPVNFVDPFGEQGVPPGLVPGVGVPPIPPGVVNLPEPSACKAGKECAVTSDVDPPDDILKYCEQLCEPHKDDLDVYIQCLFRCFDSRN